MINISEKGMNAIRKQADKAITGLADGKTVRDTLIGLYVAGLPDKTEQQGMMMADRVIETVAEYGADCKAALADADGWMNAKLDAMLEGKPLDERCQFLFELTNALSAVSAEALSEHMTDGEAAELCADIGGAKIDPKAITPELEAELRERALEGMGGSALFLSQADEMAALFQDCAENGGDITECVVDFGTKSADYKAVAAMIAYVAAKNGTVDGIPPDANIGEITLGVCAAIEIGNVAAQVEEGSLTEDAARLIIKILGMVAAVKVIYHLFLLSVGVGVMFGGGGVLGMVAGLLTGVCVAAAVGPVIIRLADKLTGFAADITIKLVSAVVGGLKKLGAWFRAKVSPKVTGAVGRGVRFTDELVARGVVLTSGVNRESVKA